MEESSSRRRLSEAREQDRALNPQDQNLLRFPLPAGVDPNLQEPRNKAGATLQLERQEEIEQVVRDLQQILTTGLELHSRHAFRSKASRGPRPDDAVDFDVYLGHFLKGQSENSADSYWQEMVEKSSKGYDGIHVIRCPDSNEEFLLHHMQACLSRQDRLKTNLGENDPFPPYGKAYSASCSPDNSSTAPKGKGGTVPEQEYTQLLEQLRKAEGARDQNTVSLYGERENWLSRQGLRWRPYCEKKVMTLDGWMPYIAFNEEFLMHYFQGCLSRLDPSKHKRGEQDRFPPPAPPHPHETSPKLIAQRWEADWSDCKAWEVYPQWWVNDDVTPHTDWSEISAAFCQDLRARKTSSNSELEERLQLSMAGWSGTSITDSGSKAAVWDFCPGPLLDHSEHESDGESNAIPRSKDTRSFEQRRRRTVDQTSAEDPLEQGRSLHRKFQHAQAEAAKELERMLVQDRAWLNEELAALARRGKVYHSREATPHVKELLLRKSWGDLKAEAMQKEPSHGELQSQLHDLVASISYRSALVEEEPCKPGPQKLTKQFVRYILRAVSSADLRTLPWREACQKVVQQVLVCIRAAFGAEAADSERLRVKEGQPEMAAVIAKAAWKVVCRSGGDVSLRQVEAECLQSFQQAESTASPNSMLELPSDWLVPSCGQPEGSCLNWAGMRLTQASLYLRLNRRDPFRLWQRQHRRSFREKIKALEAQRRKISLHCCGWSLKKFMAAHKSRLVVIEEKKKLSEQWEASEGHDATTFAEEVEAFEENLRALAAPCGELKEVDLSMKESDPVWAYCPGPLLDAEDPAEWLGKQPLRQHAKILRRIFKKALRTCSLKSALKWLMRWCWRVWCRHKQKSKSKAQRSRFLKALGTAAQELASQAAKQNDVMRSMCEALVAPPDMEALLRAPSWRQEKAAAMTKACALQPLGSLARDFTAVPASWDFGQGNVAAASSSTRPRSRQPGSDMMVAPPFVLTLPVATPPKADELERVAMLQRRRKVLPSFTAAMTKAAEEIAALATKEAHNAAFCSSQARPSSVGHRQGTFLYWAAMRARYLPSKYNSGCSPGPSKYNSGCSPGPSTANQNRLCGNPERRVESLPPLLRRLEYAKRAFKVGKGKLSGLDLLCPFPRQSSPYNAHTEQPSKRQEEDLRWSLALTQLWSRQVDSQTDIPSGLFLALGGSGSLRRASGPQNGHPETASAVPGAPKIRQLGQWQSQPQVHFPAATTPKEASDSVQATLLAKSKGEVLADYMEKAAMAPFINAASKWSDLSIRSSSKQGACFYWSSMMATCDIGVSAAKSLTLRQIDAVTQLQSRPWHRGNFFNSGPVMMRRLHAEISKVELDRHRSRWLYEKSERKRVLYERKHSIEPGHGAAATTHPSPKRPAAMSRPLLPAELPGVSEECDVRWSLAKTHLWLRQVEGLRLADAAVSTVTTQQSTTPATTQQSPTPATTHGEQIEAGDDRGKDLRWSPAMRKLEDRLLSQMFVGFEDASKEHDLSLLTEWTKKWAALDFACFRGRALTHAEDVMWLAIEAGSATAVDAAAQRGTRARVARNSTRGNLDSDAVVTGLRLQDLEDLVVREGEWLKEEILCKFSGQLRKKNMYDVCPELIIPSTTSVERIVTLLPEDEPKFKAASLGGLFASDDDLTLVAEAVLGGQTLPPGLTVHGKLVVGGEIRRRYWKGTTPLEVADRQREWRTIKRHGREQQDLKVTAPVPANLLELLEQSPGEQLGEASDRVRTAGELEVGDTIVLRRGVSYVQMCSKDGKEHALQYFVSHFWGEETLDFYRALAKHATSAASGRGRPGDCVYYVCTFNNNQHCVDLGDGWRASPFNRALEYLAAIAKQGAPSSAVMVLDSAASPLRRKWCVFEAWRCAELELPLCLLSGEGEVTRNSKWAHKVIKMVQDINLEQAGCSVKRDADIITHAIEDSKGGFLAVHAKVRMCVLDLMSFIGTLAMSLDPITGKMVDEVELQVRGRAPPVVDGKVFSTSEVAEAICSATPSVFGRSVLLVAPAGSGKSVFSRALVRAALDPDISKGQDILPIRAPLAELGKIAAKARINSKLRMQEIEYYHDEIQEMYRKDIHALFEVWAKKCFLRDSATVTEEGGKTLLLILDGFDEAGNERAAIIMWLRHFLRRRKKVLTLLTSRPSGLDELAVSSGQIRHRRSGSVKRVHPQGEYLVVNDHLPAGTCIDIEGFDTSPCYVLAQEMELELGKSFLKQDGCLILTRTGTGDVKKLPDFQPGSYSDIALVCRAPHSGQGGEVTIIISEREQHSPLDEPFQQWCLSDWTKDERLMLQLKEEQLREVESKISEGNQHFQAGKFSDAALKYKHVVEALTRSVALLTEEKQQRDKIKFGCHLNMAHCYIKQQSYSQAKTNLDACLSISDDVKARFRRAHVWEKLGEIKEAMNDINAALKVRPEDKDLLKSRSRFENLLEKQQTAVDLQKGWLEIEVTAVGRNYPLGAEVCVPAGSIPLRSNRSGIKQQGEAVSPELVFQVRRHNKYITLTRDMGNKSAKVDVGSTSIREGSAWKELMLRDQLHHELGFSHFVIDAIDSHTASEVVRSIGGDALAECTPKTLEKFPENLWNRPLMANFFGQFLASRGLEQALSLSPSIAELLILRFIASCLMRQAASVVAPQANSQVIQDTLETIQKNLAFVCYKQLTPARSYDADAENVRLFSGTHLRHKPRLWEDAVRGHLRLFEPQAGGQFVQMSHLRIQELMAAEEWSKSTLPLEGIAIQMVSSQLLVQLGLASLYYLVQMTLAKQPDARTLVLDFASYQRRHMSSERRLPKALVTHMDKWLPSHLTSLSLMLGLSHFSLEELSASLQALPSTLKSFKLELQFDWCQATPDLGVLSSHWRVPQLQTLAMNVVHGLMATASFREPISEAASASVVAFATNLPRTLHSLELDVSKYVRCGRQNPFKDFSTFLEQLPKKLTSLKLNFENWSMSEELWHKVSKALPRSVRVLEMKCDMPLSLSFLDELPKRLEKLHVDGCITITDAAEVKLDHLQDLSIASCFRVTFEDDDEVNACLAALQHLQAPQLTRCSITRVEYEKEFRNQLLLEGGSDPMYHPSAENALLQSLPNLSALSLAVWSSEIQLPVGLQELFVNISSKSSAPDEDLASLAEGIAPLQLRRLAVLVDGRWQVTDKGLLRLAESLPESLHSLGLDISGCSRVSSEPVIQLSSKFSATLQELGFKCSRTGVDDTAWAALLQHTGCDLQKLTLDFSRTTCTDVGLKALARSLRPELKAFSLAVNNFQDKCKVSDDGLNSLFTALKATALTELELGFQNCFSISSDCLGSVSELPPVRDNPDGCRLDIDYASKFVKVAVAGQEPGRQEEILSEPTAPAEADENESTVEPTSGATSPANHATSPNAAAQQTTASQQQAALTAVQRRRSRDVPRHVPEVRIDVPSIYSGIVRGDRIEFQLSDPSGLPVGYLVTDDGTFAQDLAQWFAGGVQVVRDGSELQSGMLQTTDRLVIHGRLQLEINQAAPDHSATAGAASLTTQGPSRQAVQRRGSQDILPVPEVRMDVPSIYSGIVRRDRVEFQLSDPSGLPVGYLVTDDGTFAQHIAHLFAGAVQVLRDGNERHTGALHTTDMLVIHGRLQFHINQ